MGKNIKLQLNNKTGENDDAFIEEGEGDRTYSLYII